MRKTALRRARAPVDGGTDDSGLESVNFGEFPSLIGYRIRRAYGRVFQTFNEMFAPLDLAFGQYSVLALIGLNPGISQIALADISGIDRSTVVPITDRFVQRGWVQRTRRTEDRRVYSLRVTPVGQQILNRAKSLIHAHEEQLVSALNASERAQLLDLLARISDEHVPVLLPKRASASRRS